jgi:hypothetical protein
LVKDVERGQNFDEGMILEVICGYDIKVKKNWRPYVEIVQKYETMPDTDDRDSVCSAILTDGYVRKNSARSSNSSKAEIPLEQYESDRIVFSTPIKSIKDSSKPEWCI